MNDAHLHLIVNHFPIIGLFFALGVLIFGVFSKSIPLKNTAFVLLIITATFGFLSMFTGEGAERMVEDMPNIGHQIIHEHEELAEKFVILLYSTGILSIIGLYMNVKRHSKANLISYVIATLAVVSLILAINVGTSGGEIRHTEIRNEKTLQNNTINSNEIDNHDD